MGRGLGGSTRTLYKTPADIEGIKRSAAINVGVLDYVGEHIAAGMTTNQIDQMIMTTPSSTVVRRRPQL